MKYIAGLYADGLIDPAALTQDESQLSAIGTKEEVICGTAACGHIGMFVDISDIERSRAVSYTHLLYSDSGLPFEEEGYAPGLEAVAYLYNDSIARNGENQAIYTQKNRTPDVYRVGTLDIEKSQLPGVQPYPWQTDTCIGNWFYDAKQVYKRPAQIIEMLVDIISKNGVMLLNILQRPDGTIDEEARFLLEELAKWFAVCAEGVYGTRPFRVFGEGDTRCLLYTSRCV